MRLVSLSTCLGLLLAIGSVSAVPLIDGKNITGDFAQATWRTFQNVQDDWGGNQIMAMYVQTNASHLLIGIPGYVDNNAIVVFVDGNASLGANVIPAGLTQPERVKGMAGMTFDTGFTPETAVSLGVAGGGGQAWPHKENIVGNSTTYMGLLNDPRNTGGVVTSGNTIVGAFMPAPYPLAETNTAPDGLEIALAYGDINNNSPTVRLMAIVCNLGGDWANNHTLPPTGGDTNWQSSPSSVHNAANVPGLQYLEVILPVADTNVYLIATAAADRSLAFAGTAVTFTNTAASGTPPYTYYWNLNNGFTTNVTTSATGFGFSYVYPSALVTNVISIISDNAGRSVTVDIGTVKIYAPSIVDGLNITNDFAGKGTNVLQDTASNWGVATVPGNGAQLQRLFAYADGPKLYIGVCGNLMTNVGDNTLGIFIDVDYGVGTNVLPLVTAGGSFAKLRNLEGMTFDTDFTPDKALLLSIGGAADFWPNFYHIDQISNEWYWGNTKTEWSSMFGGKFIRCVNDRWNTAGDVMAVNNDNVAGPADATTGFEAMLDFDSLVNGGLLIGNKIKLQAILYNWVTTNVANQSLPGINGNAAGYGLAPQVNYASVPGQQYIEIDAPVPEPSVLAFAAVMAWLGLRRR
ncbi:MAG: hypothetical protein N2595_02045 [bacterium]|nr:hypothetical protein [bacterium]